MIKLMHGDCLEKMAEVEDGSVDMVLTDPPYGTTDCKWDSIIPLEPMWEHLKRVIKPNGAIVMTASQPFTTTLIASNMKMFKYCWVWDKVVGTGFSMCKKQPLRSYEEIVVFYQRQPTYNPQMIKRDKPINSFNWKQDKRITNNGRFNSTSNEESKKVYKYKYPKSLLTVNRAEKECNNTKRLHPTQKPVALMEYLIKTYTNEGETVLDFTMGSGTTGVACKNLNRSFIGIEMDDKYFKIAEERINLA